MTKYIDTMDEVIKQMEQNIKQSKEQLVEELSEKIKDYKKDHGYEETLKAFKDNNWMEIIDTQLDKEQKDKFLKNLELEELNEKNTESIDELKETEIVTIEIEKQFVINTGNYSSITQKYSLKREGRTKNITNFLQQTDDIISKKVNEQFNKIKASL